MFFVALHSTTGLNRTVGGFDTREQAKSFMRLMAYMGHTCILGY